MVLSACGHTRPTCAPGSSTPLTACEEHGLTWYGPRNTADRCGVFSVRIGTVHDPNALSDTLERDHGVLTRSGLHCAPLAHKTIGTYDLGGTTRLSVGPFTTPDDARTACDALADLARQHTTVVLS